MILAIGKWIVSVLTGGGLEKILDILDKKIDNETTREQIQADVTKTWINAQASLLVGRTWWFQLFFVVPLGFWFSAVCLDSVFNFTWNVSALPPPLDSWAGGIISALFIVDGGKALVGRFLGK